MLKIEVDGKAMEVEANGSGEEIITGLANAAIKITSLMDREGKQAKGTAMSILFKALWYYALNETEEENAETERVPLS